MDVILDLVPKNRTVGMGVGNEIACTAIEICKKVAKDVDGGLALGQGPRRIPFMLRRMVRGRRRSLKLGHG